MSPTSINEEQIMDALHRLPASQWRKVLEFIRDLGQNKEVQGAGPSPKKWTAAELLKLSVEERDVILAAQAAAAEQEYRTNPELTGFEAFGKDDLYGDSSNTETR